MESEEEEDEQTEDVEVRALGTEIVREDKISAWIWLLMLVPVAVYGFNALRPKLVWGVKNKATGGISSVSLCGNGPRVRVK